MGIVEGEERSACRRAPTRTETFPPRAKLRGAERHRVVELAVEELQKPSALIMAPKAKFDAKFPRYKVWLAERLVEAGRLPRKGGRVQEEFLPGLAKLEAAHGIVLEEAAGAAEDT